MNNNLINKKKRDKHTPTMKWRTLPKVGVHGFTQEHHKEQKIK